MGYDVVRPDVFEWLTRPHEEGEPARHVEEANQGDDDLIVYAYGYPPEREHADLLDSAL